MDIKKTKIIIDSSIGLTKEEAEKYSFGFISLYIFNIKNHKNYRDDGVDITREEFYNLIETTGLLTSQGNLFELKKLIQQYLEEGYENILIFPISKGISSFYNNIKILIKENFNLNQVHVVDTNFVGIILFYLVVKVYQNINYFQTFVDIDNYISLFSKNNFALFIVQNMKWLKRGGRVSKTVAALTNILSIYPVLSLKNGKLDYWYKTRNKIKGIKKILNYLKLNGKKNNVPVKKLLVAVAKHDDNLINLVKKLINDVFEDDIKVYFSYMPCVILTHVGPEIIGFCSLVDDLFIDQDIMYFKENDFY
ncbi:DegV family protein [Mycoplasma sp. SG1]|uniref:DegV family protein n=1 Tax=Mycoplasma sp. SG1 TaxID=2810348 RepID=UPI0020249F3A|nr:DegV family protein [Mycoplasma sp. SG1]URM52808.1 DegV family EDD domain-containing protein [Mycoplasma sp. SG1]